MTSLAVLTPYPADDPATAPPLGSAEDRFMRFLQRHGYDVVYEPQSYPVRMMQNVRTHRGTLHKVERLKAFTPDLLIRGCNGQRFEPAVYLELTMADRYIHPGELSTQARDKNRKTSMSRRAYVSPATYLRLKRTKIAAAIAAHPKLVVALLTGADQDYYLACPVGLQMLITGMVESGISCLG